MRLKSTELNTALAILIAFGATQGCGEDPESTGEPGTGYDFGGNAPTVTGGGSALPTGGTTGGLTQTTGGTTGGTKSGCSATICRRSPASASSSSRASRRRRSRR